MALLDYFAFGRTSLSPMQTANNFRHCWMLHHLEYMLIPFPHFVACCFVLLGVASQSLRPVKLCEDGKGNAQQTQH